MHALYDHLKLEARKRGRTRRSEDDHSWACVRVPGGMSCFAGLRRSSRAVEASVEVGARARRFLGCAVGGPGGVRGVGCGVSLVSR